MSALASPPLVSFASTKPLETIPEAERASKYGLAIISIWPGPLVAHRKHAHSVLIDGRRQWRASTTYSIPAAPRGSYSKLVVYDTQQYIKQLNYSNADKKDEFMPAPIQARVVAEDLINTWAGDTLGARSGYRPGIDLIAGQEPTDGELARITASQENLFNWYINQADYYHGKQQMNEITDVHRLAARYMLGDGAEILPWYMVRRFADTKACPACEKQIDAKSKVCTNCSTNLVDWYMKYGIMPDKDGAVRSFIEQVQQSQKQQAQPKQPVHQVTK